MNKRNPLTPDHPLEPMYLQGYPPRPYLPRTRWSLAASWDDQAINPSDTGSSYESQSALGPDNRDLKLTSQPGAPRRHTFFHCFRSPRKSRQRTRHSFGTESWRTGLDFVALDIFATILVICFTRNKQNQVSEISVVDRRDAKRKRLGKNLTTIINVDCIGEL